MFIKLIVATFLFNSSAFAEKISPFWETNRQRNLHEVLEAFSNSKLDRVLNTQGYLRNSNRYGCSSDITQLRIQCLMEVAKQQCQSYPKAEQENCLLYSDIIVSNLMELDLFIPKRDLFRIYRNSVGVKDPTKEALRRRYAIHAVQFINESKQCEASDLKCLAAEIDKFCLKQTTQKKQSYQGCTSSLVWFYSTQRGLSDVAKNI
jgi:hypothetical protein